MSRAESYVGLLRGVNVGGKHKLPMKALVETVSSCDCANVRTYIQSGNVVFTASRGIARKLPMVLAKKIEDRFGFAVPVILRRRDELARVVRDNPFLGEGMPENLLHVYFLAGNPSAGALQTLDPRRSAPDQFRVVGQEIYLHLPNGMADTKLTSAYFDSRLETVCTARNWATLLKLLELMNG